MDWELPGFNVVPAVSRYRYIKSDDRETQIPRPAGERKSLYRNALAQSTLAVIAEIFRADRTRLVSTVTVNGFVSGADPATGRRSKVFLLTVTAGRPVFGHLDLARVNPVSCLEGLPGQFSPRPETLAPVRPGRLAAAPAADLHDEAGATQASLLDMDPIDFEDLVAALFKAMGMEVMTTEHSGDGGVDVRAMDPDPIRAASSSSRSSDTAARSPQPQSATCTARCSTKAPPRESWSPRQSSGPAHKSSPPGNRSPSSAASSSPTC